MISVVIVAKNEAANIARLVASVKPHFQEVLVVDTGSVDETQVLAKAAGAKVIESEWLGYGPTKNWAARQASNDWILSLDADELPTAELLASITSLKLHEAELHGMRRITNFCGQWVHNGAWGRDIVWRLYHRESAEWDERPVHENLLSLHQDLKRVLVEGELLHYSFPSEDFYRKKHAQYAQLGAEALFGEGKGATWSKRYLSPLWRAGRGYFILGGWRDGKAGWRIAVLEYEHVQDKYRRLADLWNKAKS